MGSVQIEHKSYEMPPRDGLSIAHFLTVKDIERSARYYEKVSLLRKGLRRSHSKPGRRQRAWVPSTGEYLDDRERRGRPDSGQADGITQRPGP
jgi:hypothetical protein